MTTPKQLRNIAIVAHVDHGKTTLVDKLLQQSGTLDARKAHGDRVMDSNPLEQERGITILAKNTAINWNDYRINIVDTPGHADFGGEVERILSMVDCVLLLVDAVDGPMPQTRFVTQKAFSYGLKPIVVVNKIDRDGARPDWAVDQVFDLFVSLDASDEQLDFPVVYASAIEGYALTDLDDTPKDMTPLFEMITQQVSPPDVDVDGPLQMQISALAYSTYVGALGIGRIKRGTLSRNENVKVIDRDGEVRSGRVLQVLGFNGLDRVEVEQAQAGDIVSISGIEGLRISDTLCNPDAIEALPSLSVDEPTVSMTFGVNTSPFSGQDGKFLTTRQISDRLDRELISNVALRVAPSVESDKFVVSGRGELHLSILIETMRREGFELSVSRAEVITKEIDGVMSEPVESVMVDVESQHQGAIMESFGLRQGRLQNMETDPNGDRVRLTFLMPTRGLIGFYSQFLTMTSGSGIMHHVFDHYAPIVTNDFKHRTRGVLISNAKGVSTGYALWNLQARGELFLAPQTPVYEGMIVGLHSRENDLVVNITREKQLTNVRASGTDENINLTPPVKFSLEEALAFINDDELVEVTAENIRLRKKHLNESDRKRLSRG